MRSCIPLIFLCLSCFAGTYTTSFVRTENPVSENGLWSNGGLDWSNCLTANGMIQGNQGHDLSDSIAHLTGLTWAQNQGDTAIIYKDPNLGATNFPELELHLNFTVSGHAATGYEFLYSMRTDLEHHFIVRWDFPAAPVQLADCGTLTITNGATLRVTNHNGTLQMYVGPTLIGSASDSTYTAGSPGVGFDSNLQTYDYSKFGITNFVATDGVHSVTNYAASIIDLQPAINVATNCQDVVLVPPITNIMQTQISLTNGIWLIGAGTNSNNRTLWLDKFSGNYAQLWTLASGCTTYITGFYYSNALASSDFNPFIGLVGFDDLRRIRIYGNVFDKLFRVTGFYNSAYGVFDHNTVIGPTYGQPAFFGYVKGNYLGITDGANTYGDGAWTNALRFGTENFFFIESNFFTNAYAGNLTMLDAQAGARYVTRSNTAYGGSWESHGLEAQRERSGEAFEIYGNTNGGYGDRTTYIYHRGGVGVVWGNTIRGWGNTASLALLNNRTSDALAEPFGGADGRNPWDTNSASNPFVTGTCSGAGALTMTDSGKSWAVNQWAGFILRKTSGTAVQSMTRSGSTVTVNANGHGYATGQYVSVFQQPYSVNSEQPYVVSAQCTVVNANQFTLVQNYTPSSPATATYLTCSNNFFSEITGNTQTQLTFKDSIYGGILTMTFTAGQTYEINQIVHAMDQPGRTGGGNLAGADTPSLPSGWNNQTTDPWYGWNNTNLDNNTDVFFNPASGTIITNIHFISGIPRPGYAPYQWPHNLVGPAQSTPGAPQAVLVGPFILKGPAKIGSL